MSSTVELLKLCNDNNTAATTTTTASTPASTPASTAESVTEEFKEGEKKLENKNAKNAKKLIYVSSIGAYDIKRGEGHEERLLSLGDGIGEMMGYGATKRMSEVSYITL